MGTDRLKIKRGRNDLDVVERELTALRHDFAVECDESGTIVVQSVSIATLLISVKVDSTELQEEGHSLSQGASGPVLDKPFRSPPE